MYDINEDNWLDNLSPLLSFGGRMGLGWSGKGQLVLYPFWDQNKNWSLAGENETVLVSKNTDMSLQESELMVS